MRPRLRFLSDELIERILDEAYKLLEAKVFPWRLLRKQWLLESCVVLSSALFPHSSYVITDMPNS
jgi:hypothetical protein